MILSTFSPLCSLANSLQICEVVEQDTFECDAQGNIHVKDSQPKVLICGNKTKEVLNTYATIEFCCVTIHVACTIEKRGI